MCQNLLILLHLSESFDVPAGCSYEKFLIVRAHWISSSSVLDLLLKVLYSSSLFCRSPKLLRLTFLKTNSGWVMQNIPMMQTITETNLTAPILSFRNKADTTTVQINVIETVKLSTAPTKMYFMFEQSGIFFVLHLFKEVSFCCFEWNLEMFCYILSFKVHKVFLVRTECFSTSSLTSRSFELFGSLPRAMYSIETK